MNREINNIYCSCGGEVKQVDTTDEEDRKFGCMRKGCCVGAYKCNKCNVRWTFDFNAPEME